MIVKDHGRAEPTFIISNNEEIKSLALLSIYAKRWHIENKLADIVHESLKLYDGGIFFV